MEFKAAIAEAANLLAKYQKQPGDITEAQLEPFLSSEEGTRGFFVSYLSSDVDFAETPQALCAALRKSNPIASSIVVRNLVMSAASEASHRRSGDEEKAWASAAVAEKTGNLIADVNAQPLWNVLSEMRKSLLSEGDAFNDFLGRMNYSDDEKLTALTAVNLVLSSRKTSNVDVLDLSDPID